jgi:hypothetical protein
MTGIADFPSAAAAIDDPRAKAAARMRRSRQRHAKGLHCLMLEIRDAEVEALVRRGLLAQENRADRAAVVKALYKLLDGTLGRAQNTFDNRVW